MNNITRANLVFALLCIVLAAICLYGAVITLQLGYFPGVAGALVFAYLVFVFLFTRILSNVILGGNK